MGLLIILGVLLMMWRRRKHREEKEALEYENQVRTEFGRRLEDEFDEDDEPGSRHTVSIYI